MRFDHEKLHVYQAGIELAITVDSMAKTIKGHHRHLRDQLIRSSQSIPLNIAEGNGKRSSPDRKRFFEIARASATESAASVDLLHAFGAITHEDYMKSKTLLYRIVSMLTKMTSYGDGAREVQGGYGSDTDDVDYELR